ncbi:hypothetical protein [Viridibacillus arvi]|uniref:hypothetical protein n=1 Tax=Viridibacillus arvi TaxID=263475 RepID=UPI003CFD5BC8
MKFESKLQRFNLPEGNSKKGYLDSTFNPCDWEETDSFANFFSQFPKMSFGNSNELTWIVTEESLANLYNRCQCILLNPWNQQIKMALLPTFINPPNTQNPESVYELLQNVEYTLNKLKYIMSTTDFDKQVIIYSQNKPLEKYLVL